jgi:hypothetical protein
LAKTVIFWFLIISVFHNKLHFQSVFALATGSQDFAFLVNLVQIQWFGASQLMLSVTVVVHFFFCRDIQAFVLEQLMDLKSFFTTPMAANQDDKGKQLPFDKEFKLQSLATEISLLKKSEGRDVEKQPVCSSPTSSIPSSLGVYPSWQMISRISSSSHKDVNKLPSKEIFEDNKSFPFTKLKSPEFKSFLDASLSDSTILESRSESTTIEPKTHEELKDKLRDLFEKLKEQARRETGVSLPSPPRLYSEISEPGGMSQWTEVSDAESLPNSHCFSSSSAELNKGKFDISASDLSFEIKFGEVDS